jgi:Rap1a immunity proteins
MQVLRIAHPTERKDRELRSHWQRVAKLILAKEMARVTGRSLARHTGHLAGRHHMSTRPKPPPYPKPPRPPAEPPRPQPGVSMLRAGALAFALIAASTVAAAQDNIDNSANFMPPHCKRFLAGTGKETFTEGLYAGSITAFAFVGRSLDGKSRFCFPKGATRGQMIRVVVAYIEARPARMHEEWRELALEALREAWPCSSTNERN